MKTAAMILIAFVLANVAVLFCATQLLSGDADVETWKGFDVVTRRGFAVGFAIASGITIALISANVLRRTRIVPWVSVLLFVEVSAVAVALSMLFLDGVTIDPIASVATSLVVFTISTIAVSWWAIVCYSFTHAERVTTKEAFQVVAFQLVSCTMLAALSAYIVYDGVIDASWATTNEWIEHALFIELMLVSFPWAVVFVHMVRKEKMRRRVSAE